HAGGGAAGESGRELDDLGGVGVPHRGDVGQEAVPGGVAGGGDLVEHDCGVAGAVVLQQAAVPGEGEAVAELRAHRAPAPAAVADRAGAGSEPQGGRARRGGGARDRALGVEPLGGGRQLEGLVDDVDDLVHHVAAGDDVVGVPG